MRRLHLSVILGLGAASSGRLGRADELVSDTFEVQGVKIHYLEQGKGQPVLLIHGLYSSAEMNWKLPGIFAALAKDYRVVALDLPGHGQSDKPQKEEAYGLQIVEDVTLLLDRLKIKKAHVVGYSMGGIVALKFVAEHPDRVSSCALGGMGWLRDGSGLQKVWERMPGGDTSRTPPAFVHSMAKLALSEEELRHVSVPVEVLVGDHDPMKRLYVEPLQRVRKDWPVVEIQDARHISCIMKKQFRDELAAWLKKQSK